MSCSLETKVLRLDAGPLSDEARQSLRAHSETCPHCRGALGAMASAREALQKDRRLPHPSASVRVWARLEAEREGAQRRVPLWAFATAGLAVVTLFILLLSPAAVPETPRLQSGRLLAAGILVEPGEPLPQRTALFAEDAVRFVSNGAELELAPGSSVRLSEVAVDLIDGQLTISALDTPQATVVRTKATMLAVVAGRVALEIDGEFAHVRVEDGRARVERQGGTTSETLQAGTARSYRVEAPTGDEVPQPPPPPPPAPAPAAEAPGPTRAPPAASKSKADARSLEAARAMLPAAPKRARVMAQDILDQKPEAEVEAAALALMADAERRSGRLRDALSSYGRVVDHPQGATFAEEALLRQAMLHDRLGETEAALQKLATGERLFAGGVLAPERAALEAELHLEAGRVDDAARALERVPEYAGSLAVARLRVELAEALQPTEPERAARLAAPALASPDAELRRRATRLGALAE